MRILSHAIIKFVLNIIYIPIFVILLAAALLAFTRGQSTEAIVFFGLALFLTILAKTFAKWLDNRL